MEPILLKEFIINHAMLELFEIYSKHKIKCFIPKENKSIFIYPVSTKVIHFL